MGLRGIDGGGIALREYTQRKEGDTGARELSLLSVHSIHESSGKAHSTIQKPKQIVILEHLKGKVIS